MKNKVLKIIVKYYTKSIMMSEMYDRELYSETYYERDGKIQDAIERVLDYLIGTNGSKEIEIEEITIRAIDGKII